MAGRRDRAILELFYASGLRLSELVDLDLEDVSLSSRVARVRGKGAKERMVPFNAPTAEAIRVMTADRIATRAGVVSPPIAARGRTPDRHRRQRHALFL